MMKRYRNKKNIMRFGCKDFLQIEKLFTLDILAKDYKFV